MFKTMKKILTISLFYICASFSMAQEAKLSFGTDTSASPNLMLFKIGKSSEAWTAEELQEQTQDECEWQTKGSEVRVGFDRERFNSFDIRGIRNIKGLEIELGKDMKLKLSTGVNKLKLNCSEVTFQDNLDFGSIEAVSDYVNIKTNSVKVGNMTYSYPGGFTLFRGTSNLMPYCFAQDRINQIAAMDQKQAAFHGLSASIENGLSLQSDITNVLRFVDLDEVSVKNTLEQIASKHLGNSQTKLYSDYKHKYIDKLHVDGGYVKEQDFANALYDLQKVVLNLAKMSGKISHVVPDCVYDLDITDLNYYASSGKTVKYGMQLVQSELDKYLSSSSVSKSFDFKTTASTQASVSTKKFIEQLNASRGGNLDFNTITGIMVNIKVEEMLPIIELCLSDGEPVDFRDHPEMFLPRGDENNLSALQQLKTYVNTSIKQSSEPIKFRRGFFTNK